MSSTKIFNDPIYGFIMIPKGLIMELIDHPWFQRLRRIKQLGLSHFVYPGAVHTRFHHALGAYQLMTRALEILKFKGNELSPEEFEGAQIAALLHDIGHGPFSHVLEHSLVSVDHETMTLLILHKLNLDFGGKLDLAISIFKGDYPKKYLTQLVSSQLDVDRLDYLNRDSFYSGVKEGAIGYDRMLTMMDVVDQKLVFEEKVVLSVENYLAARRLMYWQVYMHKTSLAAEHMLELVLKWSKQNRNEKISSNLEYFLDLPDTFDIYSDLDYLLSKYQQIDDSDIDIYLKSCLLAKDSFISGLAKSLLSRKFYKVLLRSTPFEHSDILELQQKCASLYHIDSDKATWIVHQNTLEFSAYDFGNAEVCIRTKNQELKYLSEVINLKAYQLKEIKYFITIPPELL